MNWEIRDCLIRLESNMYDRKNYGCSPSSDRYSIEEYILELEKEIKELRSVK